MQADRLIINDLMNLTAADYLYGIGAVESLKTVCAHAA